MTTKPQRYNANLGTTKLKKRRRNVDPMAAYDALPSELRKWLMDACLPWSPASCLKIWNTARTDGASPSEIMARLTKIEIAMLARDTNRFEPVRKAS